VQSPTRKPSKALTFLAVPLIIAGCVSSGGIVPQSRATDPASLDAGPAVREADASAHWPDADWWRAYNDPQLNALVAAAQAGSPTLAAAGARVREAQSLAGVAKAALYPQVNGNLSITREHWPGDPTFYGPGTLANQQTWNNTGTVGLSYSLDMWGRDENAAHRALDAAHQRAADARGAQLELEVNVVRVYIDFSEQYALLDIATNTLARQRQLADLARRRLAGGLGTQLELSQAEAPIPEYERRIDAFGEAIELDRNQLAALIGQGPGAGSTLTRPTLVLTASAALPSKLPAELIGHRPDVVAARWAVAGEARGIDVARAAFYPNIDLIASIGGFATTGPLFQFLHAANGGWTGGPALSLPIFDAGALRGRFGAASASYDEAIERYNGSVIGALKEIADQLVRSRSLAVQQQDAERSERVAEQTYQLSLLGFKRGLTDYVNVIVAEQQWLSAQDRVAQTRAERLAVYAALMGALGGGLAVPADGPSEATMQPARKLTPFGVGARKEAAAPSGASAVAR
jgi:NodT family efflux transporter outer membrane factor (OMF) lipoprotein